MNISQTVLGFVKRLTSSSLKTVLLTALFGGFFVPLLAFATITSLTLNDPDGGEKWRGTQDITWDATTIAGGSNLVSILLSTDSGENYNTLIANNIDATLETYLWDTNFTAAGALVDGSIYKVKITDGATGIDFSSSDFMVDNTDPVTTATPSFPASPTGWYNIATGVPTIALSCDDGVGSGCSSTSFAWDGGILAPYTVPFSPLAEGVQTLNYRSEDNAVDNVGAHNVETTNNLEIKVDTEAPEASVSYSKDPVKAGDSLIITTTFNEGMADSPVVNIAISGANTLSAVAMTKVSATEYTYTHTVDAGDGTVTVAFSVGTDPAGNPITPAPTSGATFTVDNTAPVLAEVTPVPTPDNDNTPDYTFSTDEAGTIAYPGTCSSATTSATPTNNTITLNTLADGSYGGCSLTVTDTAGNTSATLVASTFIVDTVAPNVDAGTDKEVKIGLVQNATTDDNTGSGIASHAWSKVSGPGVVTFLTPTAEDTFISANTDGTYVLRLTVTDNAGNVDSDDMNFVWDTTAPVLGEVTAIADPTSDNTPSYEFSVDSVGYLPGHSGGTITYGGSCTSGDLTTAADGNNTTTYATLADATYADCTIDVIDAAGNSSSPGNTLTLTSFEVDTIPAVTTSITTYDTDLDGKIDKATIVFDNPIDDSTFTPSDFTIEGVPADGKDTEDTPDDETISVTWSSGVDGTGAKSLVYGSTALDLAGNTIAPFTTPATDAAKPVLLSARTVTTTSVDATFSEDLDGSTVNGTGSEFTVVGFAVSGATESAPGVVTLTVATMPTDATPGVTYAQIDVLNDLAAAPNTAVTPTTVTAVDGVAPVLTAVSIVSDNSLDTELAKVGDMATLSFTSSEDTATSVVTIDGGTATVLGGPSVWTAEYTFVGGEDEGVIPFSIAFEDLAIPAHNVGITVTTVTDASSVLYDRTIPAVVAGTNKEVNVATLQDATISDATPPSGSGLNTWAWTQESGPGTVTFAPSDSGVDPALDPDVTVSADTDGTYVAKLTVTDHAGNSNEDTFTFIWDTTNPVQLTSDPSDGTTGVETGVALPSDIATVTFDEPIVLLDASRVLLVNDSTGASHKGTVAVDGGDATILNIEYSSLAYGTKYRINVKPGSVSDVATNQVTTNFISYFTTEIDTIPPVVNSFSASAITSTGATLNVTTDEGATCRYATTDSSYASMSTFDTTGGTTHTHVFGGLTPSTGYDYFVRCADTTAQINTMTTSAHVSFTTLTPDTTGPVISNIQATSITETGATITWDTDENATSRVEYGPTSSYGTLTTLDVTADNTTHSVVLSGLTNGTDYHFRVISADAVPNSSTSGDNTFTTVTTIDTTAPDVPVITTADATVDADTYTVAGTVADDGGTRVVSLYNSATLVGTASVPAGDTVWSIPSVPLTQDSANVFTSTADDEAGNTSSASSSVTITEATAVGDTVAPAVPVISGADESVDADTYTLSGTAGADTPTDGPRTITIYRNSVTTVVGSIVLPAGETSWSFVAPLLQNTTNTFTAYSTDQAGNTSAVSNSRVITEATVADTTAPDVPVITTADATIDADTYTIEGTVADDGGIRLVSLYNSATLVGTASVPAGDTAWSILAPLTQDSANVFTATATDEVGNTSSASASVTITEASSADTSAPPVPAITTSDVTVDAGTYTINGTAGADTPTDTNRTITISRNGTVVGSLVLLSGETNWSFVSTLIQDTTNVFTAVSTDASGNASSASSPLTITEAEGPAGLAVTGIDAVDTFASATDDFDDGWSWIFHVTIPTVETNFSMKFSDFVSGANSILAADNIRFFSAQSSDSFSTSTATTIIATNTYAGPIDLTADLDESTAGRQIEVTVQMKVPVGSSAGSYSGSYGILSDGPIAPPIPQEN